MAKPGIAIDVPGFRWLRIERVVTDYTGTLSFGGKLASGAAERLRALMELMEIDVLTSDTFRTAHAELAAVPLEPHILKPHERHDVLKKNYAKKLRPARVAALGNGNNDALLLRSVREAGGLAIAVDNGEGCAVRAMQSANVFIVGIANALDLLLDTRRLMATLRR
jgi:soluble P-type ATPase